MNGQSIFVIAYVYTDDYGDRQSDIDEDYGYYLTAEDAQEAVDKLDGPQLARHKWDMAKYEKDMVKYKEQLEKAKTLGLLPSIQYPISPYLNGTHEVVEIEPAAKAEETK